MKSCNVAVALLSLILIGCMPEMEAKSPAKTDKKSEEYQTFIKDNFAYGKLSDILLKSSTPGTLALLSCCMYYESELQRGIAAGQKWVYTNSGKYSPQSSSFDNMVKSGKWGCNCAMPAGWAYIDMGILREGQRFWGDTEGDFHNLSKVESQIKAAAEITHWEGGRKFKDLFAEGKVKSGDVFLAKGHTFIYMGDKLFLAAGHDGKWHTDESAPTEDSCHAVFDSWVCEMKSCSNYNYTVYWQISFKDSYIPSFYRNAAGQLVPCPVK